MSPPDNRVWYVTPERIAQLNEHAPDPAQHIQSQDAPGLSRLGALFPDFGNSIPISFPNGDDSLPANNTRSSLATLPLLAPFPRDVYSQDFGPLHCGFVSSATPPTTVGANPKSGHLQHSKLARTKGSKRGEVIHP